MHDIKLILSSYCVNNVFNDVYDIKLIYYINDVYKLILLLH